MRTAAWYHMCTRCTHDASDTPLAPRALGHALPIRFSGDYFLPGSPLEGWSVEWRIGSASAGVNRKINKGLAYVA